MGRGSDDKVNDIFDHLLAKSSIQPPLRSNILVRLHPVNFSPGLKMVPRCELIFLNYFNIFLFLLCNQSKSS